MTMTTPSASSDAGVDRLLTINGLRIHYLDWGRADDERAALVLLHGIGRLARSFEPIAAHFTNRFRVIAIDMRGHGDSDWHPQAKYLVEDYVEDLEGLVEQLQLRSLVVWGNSTGGRVAQVFAGRHPELTRGVIVEDSAPSGRRKSRRAAASAWRASSLAGPRSMSSSRG